MEYNDNIYELVRERFGIIGNSKPIERAINLLLRASPTDLAVLITGETGTGKEVFAKAIHGLSKRAKQRFVSVNCAAIPENLLESELFGHEKGAYTGATDQRIGFFETANKGTIFLDEIGEIPLQTQVKLLRVLESGEFSRLGSSANHQIDVRIVAATNRDLENEINIGNFRSDLFFRLKNIHILLPPLREHIDDIPVLTEHFASKTAEKLGFQFVGMDLDTEYILKSLHWKGNIRELKNLIETIVTLEKTDYLTANIVKKYLPAALPAYQFNEIENNQSLVSFNKYEEPASDELGIIFRTLLELKNDIHDLKYGLNHTFHQIEEIKKITSDLLEQKNIEIFSAENALEYFENMSLEDIEKKLISHTLKRLNGNRRLVAQTLGISERTLYRKINQYDI